jgi:TRAP-type C4-dicarboxylate transport system permease small subunit
MPVIREAVLSSGEHKTLSLLSKVSVIVGGVAIVLMVGLVFLGTVTRFLFDYNLPPSIEYTEYLIPIVAFWGAAYALREGTHVSADIVFRRLSAGQQRWITLITYIMGLGYLITLGRHLFGLTLTAYKYHYIAFAYPLKTPLFYPQLIMSVGLVLFALQLLIEITIKARLIYRGRSHKYVGVSAGNNRH